MSRGQSGCQEALLKFKTDDGLGRTRVGWWEGVRPAQIAKADPIGFADALDLGCW